MNHKACAFFIIIFLAIGLHAVKVKQFMQNEFNNFQKGNFQNVSADSEGRLLLGPKTKNWSGPAEEFYFSAAMGKNGDLYLGTGHNAAVYKINGAGKVEMIFKAEQPDVYALLVAGNGDVIAGTSPNGKVLRITKDNKVSELFNPEEKFIWDLKEDMQGNIICAMGNTGAVYSIRKTGEVDNIFTAEDSHISSLYIGTDNSILAGSGDRGILYEIKNRKTRALFDSPLEEVKGITADNEGNIYFCAVRSSMTRKTSKEIEIGPLFSKKTIEEEDKLKEKSILYCLQPDGTVESIWSSTEEFVYALFFDPASKAVIVGTGNSGRVYRVNKAGDFSQVYESEAAQVYKIVAGNKGYVMVTNNNAAIIGVEDGLNTSGTYFSDILDAGIQSRFGRIIWDVDLTKQTTVSLSVRLGNSDNPDRSWTSWSAPFSDPKNSYINLNGYRFLQTKIVLNSANPSETPYLNGYRIYYLENNLQPQISQVVIRKAAEKAPVPDSKPPKKYLHVSWSASDPNQDLLQFNLFLKKFPSGDWVSFREKFQENWLYLDTELLEDGTYILKVQGNDAMDNTPASIKTVTKISAPFVIDSTAPVLAGFTVGSGNVSFTANDESSMLAMVSYSLDGKEWLPVFPDDMIMDSKSEKFALTLAHKTGSRVLFIKIIDEFGNYKVFQKAI
ncbi:MAG: hypothetical protein JXI33_05535 [Candidatus Aminicenantes bacterium]|nr:hypothetical protein [Candidatus Aminicenantes bacterium]